MDTIAESEIDPFSDGVTPYLYVTREATERALTGLVHCATEPARPAVLVGPPGIGKSLLLRLAAERVRDIGTRVFVPYPIVEPSDLCNLILNELGSPRFEDPVFAFEAYLGHQREIGSGLLLVVDDMHVMPPTTIRWLGHRVVMSKGEFRLIAGALDDPCSEENIALLGPACETVAMRTRMRPDESERYIRERLRLARVPDAIRARFDRSTVAELHLLSGGNPRELNAAAAKIVSPDLLSIGG